MPLGVELVDVDQAVRINETDSMCIAASIEFPNGLHQQVRPIANNTRDTEMHEFDHAFLAIHSVRNDEETSAANSCDIKDFAVRGNKARTRRRRGPVINETV